MHRPTIPALVAAALGLLLAGCGSSGGATSTTSTTATTATSTTTAGDTHAGHGSSSSATPSDATSSTATSATSATSGGSAMHGRAGDVMFAQMMIPHHEQALDLADFALKGHGASTQVQALARRIQSAQDPEIQQMRRMLKSWGAPEMPADHGMPMEGMVPEGDMRELAALQGSAFDQRWLELMTKHHQGAVSMAEDVLGTTDDPAVKRLAQDIITAQRKEIAEMQAMSTK